MRAREGSWLSSGFQSAPSHEARGHRRSSRRSASTPFIWRQCAAYGTPEHNYGLWGNEDLPKSWVLEMKMEVDFYVERHEDVK